MGEMRNEYNNLVG